MGQAFKRYDEIVFIPMSSGLSGTCQTAAMLSDDYDGKVQVVNNQRISVTMRQSVLDANVTGYPRAILRIRLGVLEREKMQSSIYITLETLKYLKKGGRITPAAAAIGTVLNLSLYCRFRARSWTHFLRQEARTQQRRLC